MTNLDDLQGAPVFDASGEIGRVVDVADQRDARHPGDLWIRLDSQERPTRIPRDQISEATPDRVTLVDAPGRALDGQQALQVPLHEEVLEASTHEVERGRLHVHKSVESVPHEETVTVGQEDVSVDRVPVDQFVDRAPEPRWEGDTLIIPLVEEVLVIEKRLRVREELRVTRTQSEERQTIREDLRREVADIVTSGGITDSNNA